MTKSIADSSVLVTGGAGFLGRQVVTLLRGEGCRRIVVPRSGHCDLRDQTAVTKLFSETRFDIVIHLAARVGGIGANQLFPGTFFRDNLQMGMNILETARSAGTPKTVMVGTICSYPKLTPVPFRETDLWNGYPEETNAAYGIAKKALLVMLQAYRQEFGLKGIYLMPVNLYGPFDNFDPQASHVIPALIRKCVEAKRTGASSITCWGTGAATREFLYVEDCARAIVGAAASYDGDEPINLGSGNEISIRELAAMVARLSGFEGEILWDASKPDGQPRRCLDTTRAIKLLGWEAQVSLEEGLRRTIRWYESPQQD